MTTPNCDPFVGPLEGKGALAKLLRLAMGIVVTVGIVHATGCGGEGETATVAGRVTLNGEVMSQGQVTFVASGGSGTAASGQIDEQGSYYIQVGQSGEVFVGEYAASVTARGPAVPSPDGAPPEPGKLLVPSRYTATDSSGLRYHVRPGENVIDIAMVGELDPPAEEEAVSEELETDEPTDDESAEDAASDDSEESETTTE